jgi:hypothetical protein
VAALDIGGRSTHPIRFASASSSVSTQNAASMVIDKVPI